MELPFLKNKQDGGTGITTLSVTRDGSSESHLLDSVTDEFMNAINKKDKRAIKEALSAFMSLIKEKDE